MNEASIVGVATGTPDGGVAIVRVSGPQAGAIGERLAGSLGAPRMVVMRSLALLDEQREQALVVWMPGPRSFTGEDIVEFHVHGGALNVRMVVAACLHAGAVAAGPGDFTRRAFEHGRVSLDEAEGIAALVGAQTEAGLAQARRLSAGEVGRAAEALRERVMTLHTEVDAYLDFPDDVTGQVVTRWHDEVAEVRTSLAQWLAGFEAGRRQRERARVVLAGPPNAGKSSLFNALVGHERAIVSEVAGTTRDYVEAEARVGRFEVMLVDTAGLREAADAIEAAGVQRSRDQAEGADVVLWVVASDQTAPEPVWPAGLAVVRVETKRDLGARQSDWVGVSLGQALSQADQSAHLRAVWATLEGALGGNTEGWIGLARHRDAAKHALEALDRATGLMAEPEALPTELLSVELGLAAGRLASIRGHHSLGPVGEELLTRVFARFCIGK